MARAVGRRLSRRLSAIIGRYQALAAVARKMPIACSISSCWRRHSTKSNTSLRIGPIGCGCRWPAPGAFSPARRPRQNELALAGSLCRHRGAPFRPLPLSRPACRRRRARSSASSFRMRRGSQSSMTRATNAASQRIHDAGLFEGRLSNGSRRYRVRARYGERQVEIEDPYRFPPILSDLDLHLLGEGTHMHLYEKLGAHPMVLDDVAGRCIRGVRTHRPPGQRRRRFQFMGRPAPRHARARQRLLGNLRSRGQCRQQVQVRDHRAGRPHAAVEIRSAGVRRRVAAARRLRSWWTRTRSRVRSPRPPTSTRCMRRYRSTRCISAHGAAGRTRAAGG